jgi:hypothetical protein
MSDSINKDWLPILTWPYFFYQQQKDFTQAATREVWMIAANGTGKTLTFYWNLCAQMLGVHPKQLGVPPITIRVLVPSFDNVEDVALRKMMEDQIIKYKDPLSEKQLAWLNVLEANDSIKDWGKRKCEFRIGPMLPQSMQVDKKGYHKDHRGIELKNKSSIWWVTTEQGWMSMRGPEQDILGVDEECGEREFSEVHRGLRNAKGGGRVYGGLTPPYKEGQGPTWTKEKVYDAADSDPNITLVKACMADNPAITQDYIEWFSKGKTKKMIDVQIYGQYPNWGDLVHPDFQDRRWNEKKVDGHLLANDTELPERRDVDWVMAFDWHQSKPCAAVFGYIDREGNLVIFDELDKDLANGKTIDELADIFRSIEGNPWSRREFRRWQDPSAKHTDNAVNRGFNAWDAFRKAGIVTSAGRNRDPDVGISIVNQYFRGNGKDTPRLFIYDRCKFTRQYLKNHFWKRGEDGKAKPDPKWSDYPVALRYIAQECGTKYLNHKKEHKWPLVSYKKQESDKFIITLER